MKASTGEETNSISTLFELRVEEREDHCRLISAPYELRIDTLWELEPMKELVEMEAGYQESGRHRLVDSLLELEPITSISPTWKVASQLESINEPL